LALAYDFTKQAKYRDAVVFGLDYLFGRNAMGQSYVTGHGERALAHPHHRFWAQQASAKYPPPPPGALSGGPNSGLQDPYVKAAGLQGCKPQKCFIDHSEAWSANEITINWNAPLTWVLAWTDEQAR
jgi:endoglucanase